MESQGGPLTPPQLYPNTHSLVAYPQTGDFAVHRGHGDGKGEEKRGGRERRKREEEERGGRERRKREEEEKERERRKRERGREREREEEEKERRKREEKERDKSNEITNR
jgi:hypothetical protein